MKSVFALLASCALAVGGCLSGASPGESGTSGGPASDAGYDACYFKDPNLGLPGCPEAGDGCIPLHYWEACYGQCGPAPDGCGGTYDCSATCSGSDAGTDATDDSN